MIDQLDQDEVTLVITPTILHEFVHVVTDGRRFEPPVAISEALAVARFYLEHPNVDCVALNAETSVAAFALLEKYKLGRKRIADTLFAASLLAHDVGELITCNPADFRIFDRLMLVNPRGAAHP